MAYVRGYVPGVDGDMSTFAQIVSGRYVSAMTRTATINDASTLGQLIEMQVESMADELPADDRAKAINKVKVTPEVKEKAKAFDAVVEHVLFVWCSKNMDVLRIGEGPLKNATTASDVVKVMLGLRGGAGYLYFMEHEGHGVGTWDGDWDVLFKTPRPTIRVLSQHVKMATRSVYQALNEAIFDAALNCMPDYEVKKASRAVRGYADVETLVRDLVKSIKATKDVFLRALKPALWDALEQDPAYKPVGKLYEQGLALLDQLDTLLVEDTGLKLARTTVDQSHTVLRAISICEEMVHRELRIRLLSLAQDKRLSGEARFAVDQAVDTVAKLTKVLELMRKTTGGLKLAGYSYDRTL